MNFVFSTTLPTVQAELDSRFPGMPTEQAVKSYLFAQFRDNAFCPVRFLNTTVAGDDFDLLVDVPTATQVSDLTAAVSPFTVALP